MKIGDVYSGNYLKAEDLGTKRPVVTIAHASEKEFEQNGQVDKKIVIGFEGKDKLMVLNKTNAAIVAENLGSDETDDWIGKKIQLEVRKVEFSGRLVPAVRVVLQPPVDDDPADLKPVVPKVTPAVGQREVDPDVAF